MPSVLDDPASRLYAGALLGKALSKQAGEVSGQEGPVEFAAQRKATLQAGVASGKIKPGSLSGADASLLGQVLSGKQHISSSPLGFLGGLASNFGKDLGSFGESLLHVPEGLYGLGKMVVDPHTYGAFGTSSAGHKNLGDVAKGIGQSVAHDFSSGQQLYEHPFNPLFDIATLGSAGAGGLVKGAKAVATAGDFAKGTTIGKIAKLGETRGRMPMQMSPGFTGANAESLAKAGVHGAEYIPAYSERPFTKYVVQKPLDAGISKLSSLQRKLSPDVKTLEELRGNYYGRRQANKYHAQSQAAQANALAANNAFNDWTKTVGKMYKGNQAKGEYEHMATLLHSSGIHDLEALDNYVERIREGDPAALEHTTGKEITTDEAHLTKEQLDAINYRTEELFQDHRFRSLIEKPSPLMKEAAYHLRRLNVHNAYLADIDPTISRESAYGRLRELHNETTDEVLHRLPKALQPQSDFAIGLQHLQENLLGMSAEPLSPTVVHDLSMHLPFGKMASRESIIRRAVESFQKDRVGEGGIHASDDPNYLQGETMYEKVALALANELGVPLEQAQAFAKGIKLGDAESRIIPTYVPSAADPALKFGTRPEKLSKRIGRNIGVAKFKGDLGEWGDVKPQNYYEVKRPFNPRTVAAQQIGLPPSANYLKDANYDSFIKGYADLRPEAIVKTAIQLQKDIVFNRLNPKLLDTLAIKGDDGDPLMVTSQGGVVEKLGQLGAAHYTAVPVQVYRNYLGAESKMMNLMGEAVKNGKEGGKTAEELIHELEGLTDESAQEFVRSLAHDTATGKYQMMILPNTHIKTIISHIHVSETTNPVARILQNFIGRWKAAVLSYQPAWLVRTTTGHGLVALIDGTVNPNAWKAAKNFEGDRPILGDRPVMPDELKALEKWHAAGSSKIMGDYPMGSTQKSLMDQGIDDLGYVGHTERFNPLAENPPAGLHLYRSEVRKDPVADLVKSKSVGMHWSARGEGALIHHMPKEGETNVVYRSVLEDPANQAIPRSHPIWQGSPSGRTEAEIRLHPNVPIRVTGAWVWRGKGEATNFWLDSEGKAPPEWEFHPLDEVVTTHNMGHISYSDHPELFAEENAPIANVPPTPTVTPPKPITASRGLGRNALPPGVNQGSMMHELADVGQAEREAKLKALPKGIQKGVHYTTNYQRRAIFLDRLHKNADIPLKEAGYIFEHPGGFWDPNNLDAILDPEFQKEVLKYPNIIEHSLDQLSHASYTFGELSPWERRLIKNAVPFYGWYKFISRFVWMLPVNYPGRAMAFAQLGRIGESMRQEMGSVPPYLEGALFFHNTPLPTEAPYVNLYGLNPLGEVLNPEGPNGFGQGIFRLGQLSPYIQAGAAAFGINPLTGGQEQIDPSTGYEKNRYGEYINLKTGKKTTAGPIHGLERGIATFLRAFPELRFIELAQNKGNPTYPESIPFIDNKVKPISPLSRHGTNWQEILEQEFGAQVRHIDVAKYTATEQKELAEALRKNAKTIAKNQAKLLE